MNPYIVGIKEEGKPLRFVVVSELKELEGLIGNNVMAISRLYNQGYERILTLLETNEIDQQPGIAPPRKRGRPRKLVTE